LLLSHKQIEPFVRQILGCQCPQEVFERIDSSEASLCGIGFQRILIGERLMVCLLACPLGEKEKQGFSGLVEALRDARDRKGWNRVRVVLMEVDDGVCDAEMTSLFEQIASGDERLHLHRIDRAQADSISVGIG
jgi:hypothetical protein